MEDYDNLDEIRKQADLIELRFNCLINKADSAKNSASVIRERFRDRVGQATGQHLFYSIDIINRKYNLIIIRSP